MTKGATALFATAVCLCLSPADAMHITQVEGKFDCPSLNNQQACAMTFEEEFLRLNTAVAARDSSGWKIQLLDGVVFRISDESGAYNMLELIDDGRFLVIREQYYEGNTWHLLDRKNGGLTEIRGYPLFSPDKTKFVAASEDLDAQYSDTVLDVYAVAPTGVHKVFQGIENPDATWAPRNVTWISDTTVSLTRATLNSSGYEEEPATLGQVGSGWELTSSH